MISARLMKSLEEEGFSLDFPNYASNEERIIEILTEDNERLLLALPLLFQDNFDYKRIKSRLNQKLLRKLNSIILITGMIFQQEKIERTNLKGIIKEHSIKGKISKAEFTYYYDSFKEFKKNKGKEEESILKKQISLRGGLNLNQALAKIYSPGKLRIMEKIFNHEELSNTELKYYYRSIRPLILAILNEDMRKYLRIVEESKKYS